MKQIKYIIALLSLSLFSVGLVSSAAAASPVTQFGATCVNKPILTFPAWYKGLQCDGNQPKLTDLNDIWIIALNIVESLIGAVAYIAAGFIIWAGFKYTKSRGDPGRIAEAKNAIIQAVIGLGIALASTAIVRYVQSIIS